jgi:hypothetical protein
MFGRAIFEVIEVIGGCMFKELEIALKPDVYICEG